MGSLVVSFALTAPLIPNDLDNHGGHVDRLGNIRRLLFICRAARS